MHDSVLRWASEVLTAERISGRRILEVGSYDVNGSARPIVMDLDPSSYIGVDLGPGPGVDVVCAATDLPARYGRSSFDVVISTEMLEHVVRWKPTVMAMIDVVAPGGLLILTTRSPGFPYHPYPIDTWRYPVEAMRDILTRCALEVCEVVPDPQVPGVFAMASKPLDWSPPWNAALFDGVDVQAVEVPEGVDAVALPPCPTCGFEDWPEGGMHAARSIHLQGHERATP